MTARAERLAERLANRLAIARDAPQLTGPDRVACSRVVKAVKNCLSCRHWARFHLGHGPCLGYNWGPGPRTSHPCPCAEFADPEPGRPDQVYTRLQIERMGSKQWRAKGDRIYLLRDGRYGLWDQWSSPEWLAKPGQVFEQERIPEYRPPGNPIWAAQGGPGRGHKGPWPLLVPEVLPKRA